MDEIKEKTVGVQESEIASLLIGFLVECSCVSIRLGRVLARNVIPYRSTPRIFSDGRTWHSFLHSTWPANRRLPDGSGVGPCSGSGHRGRQSDELGCPKCKAKIHEYFEAGVSTASGSFIPSRRISTSTASPTQIQVLQLGDELDGGDLIPGFRLPLAALFEDDPE